MLNGRSWAKPHVRRRALGQRKEPYAAVYRKGGRYTLLQETTTLGGTSWTEETRNHVQHAAVWVKKQITCVNPWKFSAAGSFRKEGICLIRKADSIQGFSDRGIFRIFGTWVRQSDSRVERPRAGRGRRRGASEPRKLRDPGSGHMPEAVSRAGGCSPGVWNPGGPVPHPPCWRSPHEEGLGKQELEGLASWGAKKSRVGGSAGPHAGVVHG